MITLFVLLSLTWTSCGGNEEQEQEQEIVTEGRLIYNLTYPYYKDEFMVALLPDQMTMDFKDNVYKNVVTKGGMFTTTLIADGNKKEVIMMLDFASKQIYAKLDEEQTQEMKDQLFSEPDIIAVDNFDSIAGFGCDKFMAVYPTLDDGYDASLYSTEALEIKNSNWCNPFSEIPEVLLGYELGQFGLVTRFEATKLENVEIADNAFDVPPGFKEVSLEQMLYEMESIFKQIIE